MLTKLFIAIKISPYFGQKPPKLSLNVLQINDSSDFDWSSVKYIEQFLYSQTSDKIYIVFKVVWFSWDWIVRIKAQENVLTAIKFKIKLHPTAKIPKIPKKPVYFYYGLGIHYFLE